MDIDRSPSPKLSGVRSTFIQRIYGVPATEDGTTTSRQLSSAPSFEVTETRGGYSVTRQCALIGDPLNDEQRSDYLSDPPSHQPVRISGSRESTNLSLGEDGKEGVHNVIVNGHRYNNQQ